MPAIACTLMLCLVACASPRQRVYRYDAQGSDPAALAQARKLHEEALSRIDRGEPELALSLLTEAVRLDPALGLAFNNLGWVHQQAGRLYPAALAYRRASELRPDDPVPLSNLGLVLGRAGRWSDAVDLHARAVSLAPEDARFQTREVYARVRRGDPLLALQAALERVVLGLRDGGWTQWAEQQLARLDLTPAVELDTP